MYGISDPVDRLRQHIRPPGSSRHPQLSSDSSRRSVAPIDQKPATARQETKQGPDALVGHAGGQHWECWRAVEERLGQPGERRPRVAALETHGRAERAETGRGVAQEAWLASCASAPAAHRTRLAIARQARALADPWPDIYPPSCCFLFLTGDSL